MADYEGSWSCIERRAQSGAAALIKNAAHLSQVLGKEEWKDEENQRQEETQEIKYGSYRRVGKSKVKFTIPFGHSLCWTLINGYCSP